MNEREGKPCEVTLYVQTPDGFDGAIKVTEVPSKSAADLLRRMSASLRENGFVAGSAGKRTAGGATATATAAVALADTPVCEECGGPTELKRGTKDGKPWSGYFCLNTAKAPRAERHKARWID